MHMPDDHDPRDAVAAADLGVWDFYPQTGALVWSQRCRALFGLSAEASVDYGVFLRGVHIDDRARVSQAVQRALTAGGDPRVDLEYRCVSAADGTLRWLWALGEASFDATTHVPSRLVGVVIDITERKQRALQDRNLSQVAESSADFIAYASPEGKLLYLNPAGLALVGLEDLAEVRGHEMIDFFTPEDQQRLRTEILPAVQQYTRWVGESRFRHFRSGRAIDVHYNLFRVDDPATGALAGYATVAVDISRRERPTEDHRFLADSVPQLLSTLNPAGDLTYVNRRAREFTGRTHEELSLNWTDLVHPDDLERTLTAWTAAQASGRAYQLEYRLRRRDGAYRWVLLHAVPQHDADGRVLQWVRSSTDIHAIKENQQELQARDFEVSTRDLDLERKLEAAARRILELETQLARSG